MSGRTPIVVALAALLAAACSNPPGESAPPTTSAGPTASAEEIARRVEEYFTKSVTPGIGLKATGIGPADVPGWSKGTLEVSAGGDEQTIPFLVTQDGRYFISGELTDLTVDPLDAVMEKIDLEGRPGRGPDDAKVTIVEYSDFQCPFCFRGYEIIEKEVLPAYEGKVRFYFKHLPLKSIHPWAESAALATECAETQSAEGFWTMYHKIFETQRELNQDNLKEKVTGFAKEAGLDEAKFAECYDSKAALAQVEKDLEEATAIGANSTPTFFINGRRLEGAQPLENFKAIIDAELG
jgi:protein-disulfide isomerase